MEETLKDLQDAIELEPKREMPFSLKQERIIESLKQERIIESLKKQTEEEEMEEPEIDDSFPMELEYNDNQMDFPEYYEQDSFQVI